MALHVEEDEYKEIADPLMRIIPLCKADTLGFVFTVPSHTTFTSCENILMTLDDYN